MARFDYQVKTNSGKVYTRSSDRVYTHAVIHTSTEGCLQGPEYCGRLDLAQKKSFPSWVPGKWVKEIYPVEIIKDRGPKK